MSPPTKKWPKYVCWALLFAFVFLGLPKLCLSHGHHDHHHHHHDDDAHHHEDGHHQHHEGGHHHHHRRAVTVDSALWAKALGSTVAISVLPFFVLFFIPIENKDEHQPFLKVLLSFASGGLLGDAFLHLIPHSLSTHDHHGHGHEHGHGQQLCSVDGSHSSEDGHDHSRETRVGTWILAGILLFLFIEKLVRVIKGEHGHSHSSARPKEKLSDDEGDDRNTGVIRKKSKPTLSVAGWLNVVADFTHNFTDGLAIGAAYLAGQNIGLVTTITVLLHEVPHEIGDYAILIQQGSSKANAMKCQLVTAVGAICGTLVSLTFGKDSEAANSWVLPFTAGGFIYIATVNVIPSLFEDSGFKQSVKEIVALLVGVYLMVLVAKYE